MGVTLLTPRKRGAMWTRPRRWLSGEWKRYEARRGALVVHYVGRRWWGLIAVAVERAGKVRELFPDHNTYEALSAMKKKKVGGAKNGPVHLAPMESVVLGAYHPLIAHMATLRYEDGDPRKPGEIRLRPAGAMWVCEALDYDARCSLQAVQATLDDTLASIVLLLEQDDAPWQPVTWMKEPPAPRAKKK